VGESDAAKQDVVGSDVLDFNPRGSYPGNCAPGDWPVTTAGVTVDPCLWFELTDKSDDTAVPQTLANNQHHQGTDWIYGGWDRDVLQADRAQNGPNQGPGCPLSGQPGPAPSRRTRCDQPRGRPGG
jgi:hypothetical protein